MFFPWIFLQFGLGGAGVQIVETRIFLRGTVMKASSHEKQKTWKNKKKVQTHGQGLGRGLAGDMGLNFLFFLFFWFFHGFLQFGQNLENTKKKQKKQKGQTHGQGLGYPNQKTKKTKKQETKKTKKQKKQDCTPQGEGVRCRVLGLVFLFFSVFLFCFLFFLFFWFVCG